MKAFPKQPGQRRCLWQNMLHFVQAWSKDIFQIAAELCFPQSCYSCGEDLSLLQSDFCERCQNKLQPLNSTLCGLCLRAKDLQDGLAWGKLCRSCRDRYPTLRSVYCLYEATDFLRQLLKESQQKPYLTATMARLLLGQLALKKLAKQSDTVTYLPQSPWQIYQQGFHQHHLLAACFASYSKTKKPCVRLFRRAYHDSSQTSIAACTFSKQRATCCSYKLSKPPSQNQRLILIEPTLGEAQLLANAAKLLTDAGAESVDAVVLAHSHWRM